MMQLLTHTMLVFVCSKWVMRGVVLAGVAVPLALRVYVAG